MAGETRPSTRGCPGIEIEPGVYSGCHDMLCWMCHGKGIVHWWRAQCHVCAGRGWLNDCPICDDGRNMFPRPADLVGLPMIGHPSSIYPQSFYSKETRDYIARSKIAVAKSPSGIFRDHNCWKCKDGAKPCVAGNPRQCEYPHAKND